ncbi:MAG TPA: hypothetical protein VF592_02455 [Sphingomonas sp.]|jgi:hypothetical protein|uniref:hypothetical protein n=1 Tax=Sphingomonas sp. TaxID=28214 RepID=UPI002ED9658A
MSKSATDIMGDIVAAAAIDAVVAFKTASRGVPNALLRDLGAVHPNTTLADLPAEVRAAITGGVRAAFTRLQKEGYVIAPAGGGPTGPAAPPRPRPAPRAPGKPPVVETKRRPPGPRGAPKGPPKPR